MLLYSLLPTLISIYILDFSYLQLHFTKYYYLKNNFNTSRRQWPSHRHRLREQRSCSTFHRFLHLLLHGCNVQDCSTPRNRLQHEVCPSFQHHRWLQRTCRYPLHSGHDVTKTPTLLEDSRRHQTALPRVQPSSNDGWLRDSHESGFQIKISFLQALRLSLPFCESHFLQGQKLLSPRPLPTSQRKQDSERSVKLGASVHGPAATSPWGYESPSGTNREGNSSHHNSSLHHQGRPQVQQTAQLCGQILDAVPGAS